MCDLTIRELSMLLTTPVGDTGIFYFTVGDTGIFYFNKATQSLVCIKSLKSHS